MSLKILLKLGQDGRGVPLKVDSLEIDDSFGQITGHGVGGPTLMDVRKDRLGETTELRDLLDTTTHRTLGLIPTPTLMALSIGSSQMIGTSTLKRRKSGRGLRHIGHRAVAAGRSNGIAAICIGSRLTLITVVLVGQANILTGTNRGASGSLSNEINGGVRLLIHRNAKLLGTHAGNLRLVKLLRNFLARDGLRVSGITRLQE